MHRPSSLGALALTATLSSCGGTSSSGSGPAPEGGTRDAPTSDDGAVSSNAGEPFGPSCATGLALAGTTLFATLDDHVVATPTAGGAATPYPSIMKSLTAIGVGGTAGYVGAFEDNDVYQFPFGGGMLVASFTTQSGGTNPVTKLATPSPSVVLFLDSSGILQRVDLPATFAKPLTTQAGLDFAVGATDVFLAQGTNIVKVALAGGSPTTLATGQGDPVNSPVSAIAADDAQVYWDTFTLNVEALRTVPVGGGTVQTLWSETVSGNCFTGPPDEQMIANKAPLGEIALDGSSVYWFGADHDLPGGGGVGCGATRVVNLYKMPKTGGAPAVLATVQPGPRQLVIDDKYVYWVEGQQNGFAGGTLNGIPCAVRRTPK
jgi:hypothetical protein